MPVSLSPEQKEEAEKLLRYLKQMEGIIRTTPNAEQKARVSREMQRYREKLGGFLAGRDVSRFTADQLRGELGLGDSESAAPIATSPAGRSVTDYSILQKFPVQKASPNSTDPDINLLATLWHTINDEYWPALSELHCKLDFSHSAEREALRAGLENISRNLKVLVETLEEYAGAEKPDFREQLLKMKNRQSRAFIFDSNEALKKLRDFLSKLNDDIAERGGIVINKTDRLKFNSRFEKATVLENRTLAEGLQEFLQFTVEAIEKLNLPTLKAKGQGAS
ncbi:MAG: hypothetical protein K1X75_04240 [Leptospirales bacterium]|nr:hypothetical protein [Leptospirales bacterium]